MLIQRIFNIEKYFHLLNLENRLLFSILEAVSSAASIDVLLSSVSDNFKLIAGIINYVMALLLMIYVIVFYRNVFLLMKILMVHDFSILLTFNLFLLIEHIPIRSCEKILHFPILFIFLCGFGIHHGLGLRFALSLHLVHLKYL